jgi:hypothetical protein
MIKKALATAFVVMAFVTISHAQDITGKWTGKIMDQFDIAYNFKVDGATLTGTTSGPDGNTIPIQNGIIKDGDLSYMIHIMDNDMKVTGKVKDDTITLTMPGMNGGDPMTVVLKKSS